MTKLIIHPRVEQELYLNQYILISCKRFNEQWVLNSLPGMQLSSIEVWGIVDIFSLRYAMSRISRLKNKGTGSLMVESMWNRFEYTLREESKTGLLFAKETFKVVEDI